MEYLKSSFDVALVTLKTLMLVLFSQVSMSSKENFCVSFLDLITKCDSFVLQLSEFTSFESNSMKFDII